MHNLYRILRKAAAVCLVLASTLLVAQCSSTTPVVPTPPPTPTPTPTPTPAPTPAPTPTPTPAPVSVLTPPVPVSPVATAQVGSLTPTLIFSNSTISATAAALFHIGISADTGPSVYTVQLSEDDHFPADQRSFNYPNVPEGTGGTTQFTPAIALKANTIYFWRVFATNGALVSAFSRTESLKTAPPPTPTPTPTPGNNPPVILSLNPSSNRVEADLSVRVTATVSDNETPDSQLVYAWSVSPNLGSIADVGRTTGGFETLATSSRSITFTSPHGARSPDVYTITLNVTENYTDASGQPKQNKAAPRSVQVHYNDSFRDVSTKASRYLTQLFPNAAIGPDEAVQDFSDSCPGKRAERNDVAVNRANFHILSGTFSGQTTINDDNVTATDKGACTFTDIPTNPSDPNFNKRELVTGVCTMTAVYENFDWFLCDSLFRGTGTTPLDLRGRVPGAMPLGTTPP